MWIGAHDVFDVNFISNNWEVKHVMIWLFEVTDISGAIMSPILQKLLDMFTLINKTIAHVKDERNNLQTSINALNSIVSCNSLGLFEPFDGFCFGHALSKVC
jgi:hypothetical protein